MVYTHTHTRTHTHTHVCMTLASVYVIGCMHARASVSVRVCVFVIMPSQSFLVVHNRQSPNKCSTLGLRGVRQRRRQPCDHLRAKSHTESHTARLVARCCVRGAHEHAQSECRRQPCDHLLDRLHIATRVRAKLSTGLLCTACLLPGVVRTLQRAECCRVSFKAVPFVLFS